MFILDKPAGPICRGPIKLSGRLPVRALGLVGLIQNLKFKKQTCLSILDEQAGRGCRDGPG